MRTNPRWSKSRTGNKYHVMFGIPGGPISVCRSAPMQTNDILGIVKSKVPKGKLCKHCLKKLMYD